MCTRSAERNTGFRLGPSRLPLIRPAHECGQSSGNVARPLRLPPPESVPHAQAEFAGPPACQILRLQSCKTSVPIKPSPIWPFSWRASDRGQPSDLFRRIRMDPSGMLKIACFFWLKAKLPLSLEALKPMRTFKYSLFYVSPREFSTGGNPRTFFLELAWTLQECWK